jgi:hypothetical protein
MGHATTTLAASHTRLLLPNLQVAAADEADKCCEAVSPRCFLTS